MLRPGDLIVFALLLDDVEHSRDQEQRRRERGPARISHREPPSGDLVVFTIAAPETAGIVQTG
jgi:hypothetical protein